MLRLNFASQSKGDLTGVHRVNSKSHPIILFHIITPDTLHMDEIINILLEQELLVKQRFLSS